ncbi:MAG: NPCBM/NEW2 domain-containing protein [Gemmataceae bacterium]
MTDRSKEFKPGLVPRLFLCYLLGSFYFGFVCVVQADETTEAQFIVRSADAKEVLGQLEKITKNWDLTLMSAKPTVVPHTQLISVRQKDVQIPGFPSGPQLCLTSGTRLVIDPKKKIELVDEHVSVSLQQAVRPTDRQPLRVFLPFVKAIWLAAPDRLPDEIAFRREFLESPRRQDVILLRSGDRILGTVLALDTKTGCKLKSRKTEILIPFHQIAAIGFNSNLLAPSRTTGLSARCILAGGERVTLTSAMINPKQHSLVGKTAEGGKIVFPLKALLSLQIDNGAATYLSDLNPTKYTHTRFLSIRWLYRINRNVVGHTLRLSNGVRDRGVGMHSASQLTYKLDAKYRWFEADVGLDAITGRKGDVVVSILREGNPKQLWSAKLNNEQRERTVRLNVKGLRTLILRVDFGRFGDVGDHVNWADARLIK